MTGAAKIVVPIIVTGTKPPVPTPTPPQNIQPANQIDLPPVPANSIPISTRVELEAIQKNLNGTFHLINDIDLSGAEWIPLGSYLSQINGFSGTLDGRGFSINNLYVSESSNRQCAGLFGVINGATIKNLGVNIGVRGVTAADRSISYAGGLAGSARDKSTITNCYVTGAVAGSVTLDRTGYLLTAYAGGMFGSVYSSAGSNCFFTGTVNASGFCVYAGGLAGSVSSGENMESIVQRSYSTADIFINASTYNAHAGGLIGEISNYVDIKNCFASGNVDIKASAINIISAGGLIGLSYELGTISNCYAYGNVSIYNDHDERLTEAGGLIGSRSFYNTEGKDPLINSYYLSSQKLYGDIIINQGKPLNETQMKRLSSLQAGTLPMFGNLKAVKITGFLFYVIFGEKQKERRHQKHSLFFSSIDFVAALVQNALSCSTNTIVGLYAAISSSIWIRDKIST